jgi:16S rRNA (adenine1518-N6/adenine1519-N6)-dimethyltransferase
MTHPAHHLKMRNLRPRKRLGQHFLKEPSLALDIVQRSGINPEDAVLEIGPGLGALTRFLAQKAARVIAVEIDLELATFLMDEFKDLDNIQIVHGDFLKLEINTLATQFNRKIRVIGNLPYNITSPVIFKLMDNASLLQDATLMVQREVATRLLAHPGGRDYGLLTVLLRYYAAIDFLLNVPPEAFHPRPKVGSTLVRLDFSRPYPLKAKDELNLRRVVKAAFSARRKMLKNALLNNLSSSHTEEEIMKALFLTGIDPKARAETLTLDQYIMLSDVLMTCRDPQHTE